MPGTIVRPAASAAPMGPTRHHPGATSTAADAHRRRTPAKPVPAAGFGLIPKEIASTELTVAFNSPDPVSVSFWNRRTRQWQSWGIHGAQRDAAFNRVTLTPAESGPTGLPRLRVQNFSTGKTFEVDPNSVVRTADGLATYSIEDRPGSRTPGNDIVITAQRSYRAAKPAPARPKRKLLSISEMNLAIRRLTQLFPAVAPLPQDVRSDVETIVNLWRGRQPATIERTQMDVVAGNLRGWLISRLERGSYGGVSDPFWRDIAEGRLIRVEAGNPQDPLVIPQLAADGRVTAIRLNAAHPDITREPALLRRFFDLRFTQDLVFTSRSQTPPVIHAFWSVVISRVQRLAHQFGGPHVPALAGVLNRFFSLAISGLVDEDDAGDPLYALLRAFQQRALAAHPGMPPLNAVLAAFMAPATANSTLAGILNGPIGTVLQGGPAAAQLAPDTRFVDAIAAVVEAAVQEQQPAAGLQAAAMSLAEFLATRGNKRDRGGAGGMAVLAGPRAVDLAADGSLSIGYLDKRARQMTVKINLGDGPSAEHLMDPWQAIAKLDPKDGDRQKLMPHIDHREQFLNALKMMQQLKAGQSIQQVLDDAPRNKASKDAAHGAMMLMGVGQDQITHLAGIVSREGIGAQATTKGKIAARALARALRLRHKFDDAKYPPPDDRARGGLDWGAALSASKVGRLANVGGRLNTVHQSPWLDKLLYGQIFPGAESVMGSGRQSLRNNMAWAGRALAQLSITTVIGSLVSPSKQRP